MRMSCNGCRVLRKGCSDNCSIRPCLEWINSPQSQAHATIFLAKFYGRAGLTNLINSGPHHLRPAIFRSLLYEACGRIVNPIYGAAGLLWAGNLHLCESAVESVLKGAPIARIPSEAAASTPVPPVKAYDVRHVIKAPVDEAKLPSADLHRVNKARKQFKRTGTKRADGDSGRAFGRARSHESSGGHVAETAESLNSMETVEASHVSQGEPAEESDVGLELALGLEPAARVSRPVRATPAAGDDTFDIDLALELHA